MQVSGRAAGVETSRATLARAGRMHAPLACSSTPAAQRIASASPKLCALLMHTP